MRIYKTLQHSQCTRETIRTVAFTTNLLSNGRSLAYYRSAGAYLCRPGNRWWAGSRRLEQWRDCPCTCWCSRCWSWCCHLCWAVDDCSRRGCYRRGSCCCRSAGRAGDGESARIRCCWCANSPPWSPFRSPAVGSVPDDRRLLHRHHRSRSRNGRHRRHRRPRPPCNKLAIV